MAKPNHLLICLAVLVSRKRVDPFEGEFKDGASIKQVVEILTVLPYLPLACLLEPSLAQLLPYASQFQRQWSGVI